MHWYELGEMASKDIKHCYTGIETNQVIQIQNVIAPGKESIKIHQERVKIYNQSSLSL